MKELRKEKPHWQIMADYYERVARDAAAIGKRIKAARFHKKAVKLYEGAGHRLITI